MRLPDRACAAFLREFESHVRGQGPHLPQHVRECAECLQKLKLSRRLLPSLEQRPPRPAAMLGAEFLESIHARINAEAESGRLGHLVRSGLSASPAPSDLPWLEPMRVEDVVARGLGEKDTAPTPAWLWARIRDDIRAAKTLQVGRRRSWRMLSLLAASLVLVFGAFEWFGGDSSLEDFEIVSVSFADLQALPHPAAVLRRGGLR